VDLDMRAGVKDEAGGPGGDVLIAAFPDIL